jgi:hypothetical protein
MKNKLTATKLELPLASCAKKGSTAQRQPYVDAMHGGNILPRATWLLVAVAILLCLGPTRAAQPSIVTGGGTGTFNADLDGDGEIDGSHFGFAVVNTQGSSASGHFMCQMAGNKHFLGLKLMLVEGRVSSAFFTPTSVTFSGTGSVNLANGTVFRDVPFTVTVSPGGPGVGTMQLTVIGLFDGVPGDTISGDNNYSLPVETVETGLITID